MPEEIVAATVDESSKRRFGVAIGTVLASAILGPGGGYLVADTRTDARFQEATQSRSELARSLLATVEGRLQTERVARANERAAEYEAVDEALTEIRKRIRELEYQVRRHGDVPHE